jgi:hypothetical protein
MEMIDSGEGLQEIKLGLFFFHSSDFAQQIEEFSSVAILHTKY